MADNENQDNYNAEFQFFATQLEEMTQKFASNMVQFEERRSFDQFNRIYREKLEELKTCIKNTKHIAISLENYVPVYEKVEEISNKIEELLTMDVSVKENGKLLEFKDFLQ